MGGRNGNILPFQGNAECLPIHVRAVSRPKNDPRFHQIPHQNAAKRKSASMIGACGSQGPGV